MASGGKDDQRKGIALAVAALFVEILKIIDERKGFAMSAGRSR